MIRIVVKRDGTQEEFSPDKLNKWAQWAEKTLSSKDFDWSTVVLETVSSCPEVTKSSDLQDMMINKCLDYNSWEGSRMAGRLYASTLPKKFYANRKHPTIKDLHTRMIKAGLIEDTGFTDEEYAEIEKIIDHKRDFLYTHHSIYQLVEKYGLIDKKNKIYYETPQFIYMRILMQSMKGYYPKNESRVDRIRDMYDSLSFQRAVISSPYFFRSLTYDPSVSSCSVLTCSDTAESIQVMNTLAYALTTAGAGVGAHYKTRSLNDSVKSGLIKHAGKIPYIRSFAATMKSSTQGCYDPETEVLTKDGWKFFKDITEDDLIVQVDENLGLSYTKPLHIFNYEYEGDMYKFSSQSTDLLVTPNHRMVYMKNGHDMDGLRIISADKLQDRMLISNVFAHPESEWQGFGDVQFVLETPETEIIPNWKGNVYCVEVPTGMLVVRRNNKTVVCGNSRSGASNIFFPYFDPEIENLMGLKNPLSPLSVRVRDSDYAISMNGPMLQRALHNKNTYLFSYKDNPKLHDMFYNGDSLTFDKELQKFAKENPDKVKTVNAFSLIELFSKHRKETGRLYPHFIDNANKQTPYKEPIHSSNLCIAGSELVPSNYGLLTAQELYELSKDLVLFDGEKQVKSSPMKLRQTYQDVYTIKLKNGMTHTVTDYHKVMTVNRGLVECKDLIVGDVIKINTKDTGLLDSSLLKHDIYSLIKEKGASFVQTLYNAFGVVLLNDNGVLSKLDYNEGDDYSKLLTEIVSVEYAGKEDVYCPTVESEEHLFVANGFVTRNCMEISNVSKPYFTHDQLYATEDPAGVVGFCNLGGINLANIKSDEEYEKAAETVLFIIERGIENTTFMFPALEANLKEYRSVGVGVNSLATLMARNKLSYTSQEGKNFIFKQAERHAYFVTKAAIKLTEEFGLCKMMKDGKSKYSEGWLPMDDASPNALNLVNVGLQYDWEPLRQRMKELGGLRFSTVMTLMPAENSSIAVSGTNSVYPIRDLAILKTSGNTATRWVAPDSTKYANYYERCWDVPNKDHLENYALWQIFNDQGISGDVFKDLTKDVSVNIKELFEILLYAHHLGLKSLYYFNFLTDKETEATSLSDVEEDIQTTTEQTEPEDDGSCGSGGCTL